MNFDGITYAKGASVLRQLVAFVGPRTTSSPASATYFAKHAFGNTELRDLLAELEAASGRDLSACSPQWLETAGVNTLAADWDETDGAFTRFAIVQSGPPSGRPSAGTASRSASTTSSTGSSTRTDRVELDVDGETHRGARAGRQQRPDLLLLNDDDLTYAKVRLDPRSLATLVAIVHLLDDGLARALVWGAAWDLTRDGEMAAADYVDLVLRGIGAETDLTAVNALLGQARLAIDYYTPRDQRQALARHFTAGLAQLLKDAEPGSDHQLAITRALALSIDSEPGAAVLKAWLEGEEIPDGLVLDADLRWRLLTELARVGAVGETEIAAELAGDKTATGAEKAAGARSASKSADAKAAAWAAATEEDTPNETHFQICSQFWQLDQDDILAPYADRYLDVVDAIGSQKGRWATASTTIRQHVLGLLFPRPLADREFLAKLDAFLSDRELPDSVKRLVLERRDDALRALHNQGASGGPTRLGGRS